MACRAQRAATDALRLLLPQQVYKPPVGMLANIGRGQMLGGWSGDGGSGDGGSDSRLNSLDARL